MMLTIIFLWLAYSFKKEDLVEIAGFREHAVLENMRLDISQ